MLALAPKLPLGVGAFAVRTSVGQGRPRSTRCSSTMPRPASRAFVFEPEHIRAMHRAFEAVCARLQLAVGSGDRVTELVGRKIIELARPASGTRTGSPRACSLSSVSRMTDRCGGTNAVRRRQSPRATTGFPLSAPRWRSCGGPLRPRGAGSQPCPPRRKPNARQYLSSARSIAGQGHANV